MSAPQLDQLNTDPFDDDLAESLEARSVNPLTTRTTLALSGLVLVVAGFVGGVLVHKQFGPSSDAGPTGGQFQLPTGNLGQGRGGLGGGQGGATEAASVTTGTVTLVDGTTIYITQSNGDVTTVKTSDTTQVVTEQDTALTGIAAGATVSITGTADEDGTITATGVRVTK
jgi:hypothetical protein